VLQQATTSLNSLHESSLDFIQQAGKLVAQMNTPRRIMTQRLLVVLMLLTILSVPALKAQTWTHHADIPYVPDGHERQKLDLYVPNGEGPFPLLVWIHGGAWRAGSKDRPRGKEWLDKGIALASINYRLSQHAIFPAQIQDCKAAIRWLRAHTDEYRLNTDRLVVWGASAGGHLVALLGTTGDTRQFDVGDHLEQSSAVSAVIDWFGPTDFNQMDTMDGDIGTMHHDAPGSPESRLVGGPIQENPDKVQKANPITHVTKKDAPFLIVHGDKDPLVAHGQSAILHKALLDAEVPVIFHTVTGGKHGGFRDPEVARLGSDFIRKHLFQADNKR